MKEVLRKIISAAMALIVLFSTMSFSVDMHYCGDHLVDFSLFENTNTCMMKAVMSKPSSSCSIMDMDVDMEMDCCTDVEIILEGQDDLKISFDQLTNDQQLFLSSFVTVYINRFEGVDQNSIPFKDYAPPPLLRNVQILDQTFRI